MDGDEGAGSTQVSRDAENAAWATDLPTVMKMVLISLSDQANDLGFAFILMENIAARCSLHMRSARRAIAALEQGGYVTRKERPGRSTIYIVHVNEVGEPLLTAERVPTPDVLTGVKRIKYAERIARENIAAMMEKRLAMREARRRARIESDGTRESGGGKAAPGSPDHKTGVAENCGLSIHRPVNETGGAVPGYRGGGHQCPGGRSNSPPESSLNPLPNSLVTPSKGSNNKFSTKTPEEEEHERKRQLDDARKRGVAV